MQGRTRPVIVQKYGGSSVADVDKIGRVADRVVACKKAGKDVVVVVSAMGKTTDGLLALAQKAAVFEGGASEPPRRELDMLLTTGERVSMALLSIAIEARGLSAISFTGSQSGILTNDRHFDARIIEVILVGARIIADRQQDNPIGDKMPRTADQKPYAFGGEGMWPV